jgi:hypothetical protein
MEIYLGFTDNKIIGKIFNNKNKVWQDNMIVNL